MVHQPAALCRRPDANSGGFPFTAFGAVLGAATIASVQRKRSMASKTSRASQAAYDDQMVSQAVFDPLQICADKKTFENARSMEIVVGRFAMLAIIGIPSAELYHEKLANALALPNRLTETGQAPTLLNGGVFSPFAEVAVFLSFAGLMAAALSGGDVPNNDGSKTRITNASPINTLEAVPTISPVLRYILYEAQLQNGRIATLGLCLMGIQEAVTGKPMVDLVPYVFGIGAQ